MSIKSTITDGENFNFYHNSMFDGDVKEVIVEARKPNSYLFAEITLTSDEMDQIAIAWIKKRKPGSVFGGPVGLEWGSPDYEW
jgi:hypothetical protein